MSSSDVTVGRPITLGDRFQGEILRLADGRKVRRLFTHTDSVFVGFFSEFDDKEDHNMVPMPASTPIVEIIERRNSRGGEHHGGNGDDVVDPLKRETKAALL